MKKLLLILLLVLAGEISAQQAATIVVKTTPDNEIAYWPTGKEHLFCIALGTKAQAGPQGEFVHQFRTDRPGMVQIWTQGSDSFTLYLTPESKTKLVPIVSSSRAAKIICDKWQKNFDYLPDAIVVEGPKAGGHLGFKKEQIQDEKYALESLIPEVVAIAMSYKERKDIPVIAAGGISTGEDIARFMQLGASAVQMGSIFVTTQECDASQTFKEVYIHSKPEDVLIIESPVGMPGRAIDGEFIRNVEKGQEKPKCCSFHCIKTCDYQKSPYCIIKALYNAAKGNMKRGYAFAGSNAFLSEKIRSVKEVITTLNNEFLLATCQLAPAKMKT